MKKMRLTALSVALVVPLALVACSGGTSGGSAAGDLTPVEDGTLTIAVGADLGTYDPYQSTVIMQYMYLAYDPLVNLDSDGSIQSGLAVDWSGDANGMSFTLGEGRMCSDGTELTPSLVKDVIDFVMDPVNGVSLYGTYTPKGAVTVTADDAAGTIEIVPEKPFGFLPQTLGNLPIVCPSGLENRDLLATGSVGTGPFVLTDAVAGDHYTFTRNDAYTWGPGGATTAEAGTPETVTLRVIENETTAANLLLSGEVNVARALGENQARLEAANIRTVERTLISGEVWYNQQADRVGSDIDVRRALTQALDLEALVGLSTGGKGAAATRLVELGAPICTGETVPGSLPEFDPEAAGKTLDAAGWRLGNDGVRVKDGKALDLDFHYVNFKGDATVAAAEYAAELWTAIGARVNLQGDTAAQMSDAMFTTSNWDIYWNGFNFSRPDAVVPWVSGAVAPDGLNFASMSNEKYTSLVNEAQALEGDAACAKWEAAERALFENLDLIPVSNEITPTFMKNAEIRYLGGSIMPTSLRVLQGE